MITWQLYLSVFSIHKHMKNYVKSVQNLVKLTSDLLMARTVDFIKTYWVILQRVLFMSVVYETNVNCVLSALFKWRLTLIGAFFRLLILYVDNFSFQFWASCLGTFINTQSHLYSLFMVSLFTFLSVFTRILSIEVITRAQLFKIWFS